MDLIGRLRSFVVERGKIACGSDIVTACNNSALRLSDLRALLAALEAAREDAFRLDEIKRSRLAVTPVEGGGWDVTVFDADDYKETLLGSGADMRAAIDEAIDQARGKGGCGEGVAP